MFIIITRDSTRRTHALWCHFCLTSHGPRACNPLRMAMAMSDPPPDDAPGDDCPEHGPYVEDCDKCE